MPIITTQRTPFKVGKAEIYREGTDVAIVACGVMVYEALIVAKELQKKGISAMVVNNHTIKPMDAKTLVKVAKKTGAIVTAEEHQVACGMGSAVAEILSQEYPVPMKMVGILDRFGESGEPDELMVEFNLKSTDIIKAVKEVIEMKG